MQLIFPPPPTDPPPGLTLIRFLGKGKSGYSYLGEYHHRQVVFKAMHHEEVSYYHFTQPKTILEENSYTTLCEVGIPVPRMLECNHQRQYLIKEFIDGKVVPELLPEQPVERVWLTTLLQWERSLASVGLNIDYFPANFVVSQHKLWYVDYEHNPWSDEYNFRNWGIWYWLNREGFNTFTQTGDASAINHPGTGKPLTPTHLVSIRNHVVDDFDAGDRSNTPTPLFK